MKLLDQPRRMVHRASAWLAERTARPAPNVRSTRAMGQTMSRRASASMPMGYDGARRDRLNWDWFTRHLSADAAIQLGWDTLTARARDLVRNDSWAAKAVERIVENVIGENGIQTEAAILAGDELDETACRDVDAALERYFDKYCDAAGRLSFAEMQALALSELPEVGEVFWVRVAKPVGRGREIPTAWQIIESEQLDNRFDRPAAPGQNKIVRGIETDGYGAPVAYHFFVEHPHDLTVTSGDSVRVPAERVIHYFVARRPSQTRGITWFAPTINVCRDLSQYVGSEISLARIAQQFVVAITREGSPEDVGLSGEDDDNTDNATGDPFTNIPEGIIAQLRPGEDVKSVQANRPNTGAEPFIRLLLDTMANGIGMTYLGLTGDVRGANLSSAKFARNKDIAFWKRLQRMTTRRMILPIRDMALGELAVYGRVPNLSPKVYAANPWPWRACVANYPGWEALDDQRETNGAIARVQAGLSTLQRECAELGLNWLRVMKQRAREQRTARELDLVLSVDQPPAGSPMPFAPPTGGDDATTNHDANEADE